MLYVVMVRVVLFLLFIPGIIGFLLISMAFYKWVFDSLEVLNGFLRQVVVSRKDVGIRQWNRWLREDLTSRPYVWLQPDFVLPSYFLVVKDPQTQSSHILVEPHLVDAEFRKAWMPHFCRSGHSEVSPEQFLVFFLGLFFCLRRLVWIFLGLRVVIYGRWLVPKKLRRVVWMVVLGMKLRLSPCFGSLVLLFFWN